MIERKIRLTDTEEVKDFVRAAGKCDLDLVVKYGEQDECFEHIMNKYAVA